MKYRISILCDNSVGPIGGTLGEHGFSALLEWEGGSLLFDTGQGDTLLHNALRMNRNLHDIRRVALSHGHYDHTGGLLPLLRTTGKKEVFAHPGIFSRRYRVREKGESTAIGIPYERSYLEGIGARFNLDESFREVGPGIFLTGEVDRRTSFEKGDTGLCCDDSGCTPDSLHDDQSIVITSDKGLFLLLGCCHAGLINTIEHAMERTGIRALYGVMGGTHLGFSSQTQADETIHALHRYDPSKISAGHCTGFSAAARLMKEFPRAFHPSHVGYTIEV